MHRITHNHVVNHVCPGNTGVRGRWPNATHGMRCHGCTPSLCFPSKSYSIPRTEWTLTPLSGLLPLPRRVFDSAQLRSAKALYVLVSEFGSTRATSLGLPLEFFRATHGAFDNVGLDQVGSRF